MQPAPSCSFAHMCHARYVLTTQRVRQGVRSLSACVLARSSFLIPGCLCFRTVSARSRFISPVGFKMTLTRASKAGASARKGAPKPVIKKKAKKREEVPPPVEQVTDEEAPSDLEEQLEDLRAQLRKAQAQSKALRKRSKPAAAASRKRARKEEQAGPSKATKRTAVSSDEEYTDDDDDDVRSTGLTCGTPASRLCS